MSDPIVLDASLYSRPPIINLASGLGLVTSLLNAMPKTAPEGVKVRARKMRKVAVDAQTAWAKRSKSDNLPKNSVDPKVIDTRADGVWTAMRDRLAALAVLPDDLAPRAARAREVLQTIYGSGSQLAFLRQPFPAQRESMAMLLGRIDSEKLGKDLDALAGSEYVPALRAVQAEYAAMVDGVKLNDGEQDLLTHVRTLGRAIRDYALLICATVDEDEPETALQARAMLAPIDAHRARQTVSRAAPAPAPEPEPVTPTTAIPEVPK